MYINYSLTLYEIYVINDFDKNINIGYTNQKMEVIFLKLTICELSYLNELITSCINSITCMSLFRNQVQDEELKSIIESIFKKGV